MGNRSKGLAFCLAALLVISSCSGDDDDTDSADTGNETAAEAGADDPSSGGPAADWIYLGRDLGNSRAGTEETEIGPDSVAELTPAWELNGIKGVTGTPIVANGVVYIGDWNGHVHALDAESGEEIWDQEVDDYYVPGAVTIDDSHVFVGTFDARVVTLDRETGEQQWELPIGDHPQAVIFGSPIELDGVVIAGVASFALMVGDAPSFRGHIVAMDAETGEEIWRYWTTANNETEGPGVSVWSTPAIDTERGQLYVGLGNTYLPPPGPRGDSVVALDVQTGEELWVNQFTGGDTWTLSEPRGPDADVGAPPNLFTVGDIDAVGAGDKAGDYRALNRDTGETLWTAELTEGGLQGGVLAGAAVEDGQIFVASNRASTDADLIALDTETGQENWRIDVEGHVSGPVSSANGVVYVSDDTGRIAAYSAEDGSRLWAHEVEESAAGGIAIVDGTVYAGWGWWFTAPPDEPKGGLIAFRLGGGSGDGDSGDSGDGDDEASEDVSGEDVYRQSCSVCHGSDGRGASGPTLVGVEERLSLEEHLAIVRDGKDEMPAWKDTLTAEEIEAVVEYERSVLGSD